MLSAAFMPLMITIEAPSGQNDAVDCYPIVTKLKMESPSVTGHPPHTSMPRSPLASNRTAVVPRRVPHVTV
jgi:hypothetical protein